MAQTEGFEADPGGYRRSVVLDGRTRETIETLRGRLGPKLQTPNRSRSLLIRLALDRLALLSTEELVGALDEHLATRWAETEGQE